MNQIVGEKPDGGKFVVLVLEPGNLQRLKQHSPILVRLEDLFPDGIPPRLDLSIYYSETPVADARALSGVAESSFDERSADQVSPHCPGCGSAIEQIGMIEAESSPASLIFCGACGAVLGAVPKAAKA